MKKTLSTLLLLLAVAAGAQSAVAATPAPTPSAADETEVVATPEGQRAEAILGGVALLGLLGACAVGAAFSKREE